jgi:hypothetical protein
LLQSARNSSRRRDGRAQVPKRAWNRKGPRKPLDHIQRSISITGFAGNRDTNKIEELSPWKSAQASNESAARPQYSGRLKILG